MKNIRKKEMKISKTKNELVVKIPLWQDSYDAIGELIGKVPNLIGCCVKDRNDPENYKYCRFTINQLCDLGYKGDQQLGMELLTFSTEEKLKEACKIGSIDIWHYDVCAYCGKPLWGSFTMDEKGYTCFECEWEKNEKH